MAQATVVSYYPRLIEEDVYVCGFTSPKSYGAESYFIRHSAGNWLTDSPRFTELLCERFEEWGGLRYIFLTHRDDVADAALYAKRFGAECLIHEEDAMDLPGAATLIRGRDVWEPVPGLKIIPVPGHTKGHCVLLYRDKFLFTGDHLEGETRAGTLDAWPEFCWHDWKEQARSMERLLEFSFEWVLPGHGGRLKLPPARMRAELEALILRMKSSA